jgi:hypothetical protein
MNTLHQLSVIAIRFDAFFGCIALHRCGALRDGTARLGGIAMLHHCNSHGRCAISAALEPKGLAMAQTALEQCAHA